MMDQLQAGICWLNHYNITPIEMPFGVFKHSGLGKENSRRALEHYMRLKSVYVATEDLLTNSIEGAGHYGHRAGPEFLPESSEENSGAVSERRAQ